MVKGKKGLGLGKGLESLIEIPEEIEKADQPEIYFDIPGGAEQKTAP